MARPHLPEILETERLVLRPWRLDDVDDVLAYAQDPEWAHFLRTIPSPYTRRHGEEFIARQILAKWETRPGWALELEGVAVGGINLTFHFDDLVAELGYSIARAHWRKGLVTEAAQAVVDAAFRAHEDLNRVHARADDENEASQRVMAKIGMTKEGVLRKRRIEGGAVLDEAWWAILREEWEA